MSSFFQRRIEKAKDQMAELENEIKLLQLRTKLISEKGLTLVRNISSLDELNSLEEYTSSYGYLSKYTKVLSEFNCNLEILLFTDGLMNELNEMDNREYLPEEENLNSVNSNNEKQTKEVKKLNENIILTSIESISPTENLIESVANIKPNELSEEKNFGTLKNSEEEKKQFFNVNVEFANSDETIKNLVQNNQNEIDNTYNTAENLNNDKKCTVFNCVESSGQAAQNANTFDNCNFNPLTSVIRPELTMISRYNNPSFINGFSPTENNFFHLYTSNSFPVENNYWQLSQEVGNQFQNFPLNSGTAYQNQTESYNMYHNRPSRHNIYLPSLLPQQNFNIWNNEYHYSNFQTWNSPSNQIVSNPSLQYVFPLHPNIQPFRSHRNDFPDNNIRWPVPRYTLSSIQATQYPLKLANFNSAPGTNESSTLQQTLMEKKIKSNSVNRNRGKIEDNLTKYSKQDEQSGFVESLEKEYNLKYDYGIRPLNFNREIGMKYNVNISYSNSPNEFYVHVNCKELELMKIMKNQLKHLDLIKGKAEPQELFSNYQEHKIHFSKYVGSYALGFCAENSSWNRLKILDWRLDSEDEMVRVLLIDYGNSIDLPFNMLRPMDSIYMIYPQFCQKCYLSGFSKTEMSPDFASAWFEESKVMFEVLIESVEKKYDLIIEIMERDGFQENESLGVRLSLPELNICINDKLKKLNTNTLMLRTKSKHMIPALNGETPDNGSFLQLGNFLPQFATGEKISVKVTCILRVNRFFCVKNYEEMNERDVLSDLVCSLNNTEKTALDTPPKVGELILGKYTDNLYYRAKVIKLEPNSDYCRVLFLDYGNTEKVSWKDMRKMEKKYLKIPFQMIECHLDGIELNSDTNEPLEAINYFTKKIEEGPVTIEIKSILDSKRAVYCVDACDRHGNNIACELVSKEYCVFLKRN